MVAPFLNIVTLCPQTYYDIVQGDLVIIDTGSVVGWCRGRRGLVFSHTSTEAGSVVNREEISKEINVKVNQRSTCLNISGQERRPIKMSLRVPTCPP